ncbi:MAG: protein jag [Chloroflexi bacterium]|nr:protein jag [Chloroflexota bacterium]
MTQKRASLESIAPTVEEAIEKGLEQLNLNREDVDVQILDEGKKTIFRFASRQARVKLLVKSADLELPSHPDIKVVNPENEVNQETLVVDTLSSIIDYLDIDAELQTSVEEQDDDRRPVIKIKIEGDDLKFLIGKKSEVLNALQYLLSLMVSHKESQWVPIQLDVQNYRGRREGEIQKMARLIADQVVETGKRQSLEPMGASERRMVHMALRKNDAVYTESVGEEPNRKIFIYPKK